MSELDLSPGSFALPETIQATDAPAPEASMDEKARQLPDPAGYKLLCAVPDVEERYSGTTLDLVKPSDVLRQEEHATTVLFVLKHGPDAYKDTAKFPNGPWCKKGDFILIRPNAGTRLLIHGREFRIIYDDNVEGVVEDPRGIKRK